MWVLVLSKLLTCALTSRFEMCRLLLASGILMFIYQSVECNFRLFLPRKDVQRGAGGASHVVGGSG